MTGGVVRRATLRETATVREILREASTIASAVTARRDHDDDVREILSLLDAALGFLDDSPVSVGQAARALHNVRASRFPHSSWPCLECDVDARVVLDAVPDVPPTYADEGDPCPKHRGSGVNRECPDCDQPYVPDVPPDPPAEMFAKRFPKWLSEHDADVKAQALEDAADELEGSLGVEGKPQNPYEFRRWLRDRAVFVRERAT